MNPEIVKENEKAAQDAFTKGDYVMCFLLIHTLIESLLRTFLEKSGNESFDKLISAFEELMKNEGQTQPPFINELVQLNRRRNRVVHELWERGYLLINKELEDVCRVSFMVFGLLIEWIETFYPEISRSGFNYDK